MSQEPLQLAWQAGGIRGLFLQCLYLQLFSISKPAHEVLLTISEMSRGLVTPASSSFRLSRKLQLYTCIVAFHKSHAVTAVGLLVSLLLKQHNLHQTIVFHGLSSHFATKLPLRDSEMLQKRPLQDTLGGVCRQHVQG